MSPYQLHSVPWEMSAAPPVLVTYHFPTPWGPACGQGVPPQVPAEALGAPLLPSPQPTAQKPFFQRVHFTAVSFSKAVQTNFCLIAHKRKKCTSVL